MSLTLKKQPKKERLTTNPSRFISIIRFVVSVWRTYANLHSWAIVALLIIFVLTGELFTRNGLLLGLVIALYVLLYYLDKWLEKHEAK